MDILSQLSSDYVVQYITHWIENNNLFIQMEYCSENLGNILTIKPIVFERKENQAMNSIEYFISCEIFRQITEALNYLHSLKPEPLIHRDLKPENILIGISGNKRVCKLTDFGISKTTENNYDYPIISEVDYRYRAPEINHTVGYYTKADIYSLGMVGIDVFDLVNPE